jgi:hypothetical protein
MKDEGQNWVKDEGFHPDLIEGAADVGHGEHADEGSH